MQPKLASLTMGLFILLGVHTAAAGGPSDVLSEKNHLAAAVVGAVEIKTVSSDAAPQEEEDVQYFEEQPEDETFEPDSMLEDDGPWDPDAPDLPEDPTIEVTPSIESEPPDDAANPYEDEDLDKQMY